MNLKNSEKKKVRGAKRKCIKMSKRIERFSEKFPEINLERQYWHMHLPVSQSFIDSMKTPSYVRRECIKSLIECAKNLVAVRPKTEIKIRVVVVVSLPYLWNSKVVIFFGEKYFKEFFERNSECQRWTLLPQSRKLSVERNIKIPSDFQEKGYLEKITDDDFETFSELWFIGELK
jgi:hypothetical protein